MTPAEPSHDNPPEGATGWRRNWRLFLFPALFAAVSAFALLIEIDCWFSQWFTQNCPGVVVRALQVCEPFGHGFGIVLIVLVIHQLDPARRFALPRVLAVAAGSGLLADLLKLLVARIRPHHFPPQANPLDSFVDWLPLLGESFRQSFPSGHTAAAVGLAAVLGWLYPLGRGLFCGLALLVACQRIACGAHWLSDVFAGAAVGSLVAIWCLRVGPIARGFERWEAPRRAGPRPKA